MESVILPKTKTIQFNGKDLTLKRLTMRQFMLLGEALESIMGQKDIAAKMQSGKPADVIPAILTLIQVAPGSIAKIASIATGLTADEVLDSQPDEVIALLKAVWDFNDLIDLLKKNLSLIIPKKAQEQAQTEQSQPSV